MNRMLLQPYAKLVMIPLFALNTLSGNAQTFTFQNWNKDSNSVFTVNAFRSVTIDKRGTVWVGSDLGGLYLFNNTIWKKANTYTDVTFRHLVPSNMPADSNVWATSIGKNAVQATTGGAYLINTQSETVTQYGSGIAGGLSSRFANSLALSKSGTTYVALAQSLTGTTTNQGGVYKISTVNPPPPSASSFTKAIVDSGDIIYYSAGNRNDELWFGRSGRCDNGICQAAYIARMSGNGSLLSSITNVNSPLPFTNASTSAFARAIFTDTTTGNTFVGLNSGGVGVCRQDGSWKMLTSANSAFPANGAVNFNAIADVYGEIWIGTGSGIFVYNGTGSLDSSNSFKLLTTANGLPSNNVTDIALDTARSFVWITSNVGVSRAPYVPPFIKGIVYNVYCNKPGQTIDSAAFFYEGLQKKPFTTGVKIKLFENGVAKDSAEVNSDGVFELTKAENGKLYTVEIKYKKDDKEIVYKYDNIENRKQMGAILIPDSLIGEVKAFKAKMEKRCFKLKLQFLITVDVACRDGFDVSEYDKAYEAFYSAGGITKDHKKRVENLADFYVASATVYSLGGTSTDLMNSSVASAFDAIESLKAFVKFGAVVKEKDALDEALENAASLLISTTKILKEGIIAGLSFVSSKLAAYPEAKSIMDNTITCINDFADLSIDILEKGKEAGPKIGFDLIKKYLAIQLAASYYKTYALGRHERFILNAANSSKDALSPFPYDQTYNKLYNPISNSLQKYAKDTLDARQSSIDNFNTAAKIADIAASVLDAAIVLSLVPGGQIAAGIAKALAVAAKIVKTSALGGAMIEAVQGCVQVATLSNQTLPLTGFTNNKSSGITNRIKNPPSQLSPATLLVRKNIYNQKLTDLKAIYSAATYDSVAYFAKYKELVIEDSLYTDEMTRTLNSLWASTDSAVILVPAFSGKLQKVIDSFVTQQYSIRYAFCYQNLAYIFDTDKTSYVAELNSMATEIIKLNDSAVNGITYLGDDINTNGIAAPAYLVQDGYKINHTHLPNSNGTFTYTFKNYGTQSQNNVRFKISKATGGYIFTSPDSIYVGTILAGESKQIGFSFTSPATDSLCRYIIDVNASNGSFKDVSGTLYVNDPTKNYSAKDGNWSDPTTWSNNTVPVVSTNVVISHIVTVDVDATCKSINAVVAGNVKINAGKNLNIVN